MTLKETREMKPRKPVKEDDRSMAEQIVDGDFCQLCGEPMDGWGFPQTCDGCK